MYDRVGCSMVCGGGVGGPSAFPLPPPPCQHCLVALVHSSPPLLARPRHSVPLLRICRTSHGLLPSPLWRPTTSLRDFPHPTAFCRPRRLPASPPASTSALNQPVASVDASTFTPHPTTDILL